MKKQFYLHFEDGMPKGTAQMKGVSILNGRPHFYEKEKVRTARQLFTYALKEHAPVKPSENCIRLTVWFVFNVKNKKLWGCYKPSKPDTDNCLKLLKDCMSGMFYIDDAQVVDERVIKTYGEKATIMVTIEDIHNAKLGGIT